MAHTPVQPTFGDIIDLNLTEKVEIYACPIGDTLEVADLIPNTSGDVDVAPTRQITRTPLHNGSDIVTPGVLQSQPFTFTAYLPDGNAKLDELIASLNNASYMKFNVFERDGSGHNGHWIVTRIKTVNDPTQSFAKEVTVEPFGVAVNS